MKAYLTTCIELEKGGLDEILSLVPKLDVQVVQTTKTIQPAWNPYFNQMWGDFKWMKTLVPNDRDIRCYATSAEDLKLKHITTHYGMYDLTDSDGILDFYFGVPNKLDDRAKKNGFNTNLAWLFIHEMLHGLEQLAGYKNAVHEMESQGRLKEMLTKHLERLVLQEKITMLTKIKDLLTVLLNLKKKLV